MFDFESVIKDGLQHIAKEQREDGGFTSLSSFHAADFSGGIPYSTTFFTSTILACLNVVAGCENHTALAKPTRRKAAAFLLGEKSTGWSFNYWAQSAAERTTMLYPDDIDDTFGALAALLQYERAIINGEALAAIVALLTSVETQEGGPYRTWLIKNPSTPWNDIDVVANSAVGYFLSLIDIYLPNIKEVIDCAIHDGAARSPYYPSAAQAFYFISRFYKNCRSAADGIGRVNVNATGEKAVTAIRDLWQNRSANMTPLENIMTMTALINLGARETISPNEVFRVAKEIKEDRWKPYAFCIDPAREGRTCYAGASALTAALTIEMLALYMKKPKSTHVRRDDKKDNTHEKAVAAAKSEVESAKTDPAFHAVLIDQIDAIANPSITTIAYEFQAALGLRGAKLRPASVDRLALGSLYGWIAYTIYDDILDDDKDAHLLPAANFFLRSLAQIYAAEDILTPGCAALFDQTMDLIDGANNWEQNQCRLPGDTAIACLPETLPDFGDYRTLADRSIGHAMGPLAELLMAGYDPTSEEFGAVHDLFHHYLIARQLHDDAHDWADDLSHGRVTSVAALVIKKFYSARKCDVYENNIIESPAIAAVLPALREIFWKETIDEVVHLIEEHVTMARQARKKSALISADNGASDFMEGALVTLEAGAKRALAERDDTLLFLARYHPSAAP